MLLKEFQKGIISCGLVLCSSLLGIRLINEYLKYNDRMQHNLIIFRLLKMVKNSCITSQK